jgi:transcriptional regulator with XRE-family HTH domain
MKSKKKKKKQEITKQTLPEILKMGERLKSLRIKRGFTSYEAFAYEHGLSRALYGRYGKGKDLRFSSLVKIVKALNMTLEEFFSEGFDKK